MRAWQKWVAGVAVVGAVAAGSVLVWYRYGCWGSDEGSQMMMSSIAAMDLRGLASAADAAVVATVRSSLSFRELRWKDEPGEWVSTDTALDVERVLFDKSGRIGGTIIVRAPGGTVCRTRTEVPDKHVFSNGERVVVFFQKWKGHYRPAFLGTYRINEDGSLGADERERSFLRMVFGREDVTLAEMEEALRGQ